MRVTGSRVWCTGAIRCHYATLLLAHLSPFHMPDGDAGLRRHDRYRTAARGISKPSFLSLRDQVGIFRRPQRHSGYGRMRG